MNRYYHAVRSPVRRPGAERYLLITLLSFALSVSLTRLFLELAGYPQVGSGELHVAHVLWGGLLLFIATVLPLTIANRWVYQVVAILSGVGIGLFIDEVGKFLTRNNDYFYPPAAPIIYAFFLIGVLIYLQVKRPSLSSPRSELYFTLEMLEDVLDHDLDKNEQAEINRRLTSVTQQTDQTELASLAKVLLEYCVGEDIRLAPVAPARLKKLENNLRSLEKRYINRGRFRTALALALALLGIVAIIASISVIAFATSAAVATATTASEASGLVRGSAQTPTLLFTVQGESYAINYWFIILQLFRGALGGILIASGILLGVERERQGLRGGYFSLLVYLTMVDLLLFYYYQFSTILSAIIQFAILMALLYYQERYMNQPASQPRPAEKPDSL